MCPKFIFILSYLISAKVILLLVLGSAIASQEVDDAADTLTRVVARSKNAIFEISIKNNQVVLNSTKNGK